MRLLLALLILPAISFAEAPLRWKMMTIDGAEKPQRILQYLDENGEYVDVPMVVDEDKALNSKRRNRNNCGDTSQHISERVWKCF